MNQNEKTYQKKIKTWENKKLPKKEMYIFLKEKKEERIIKHKTPYQKNRQTNQKQKTYQKNRRTYQKKRNNSTKRE